MSGGSSHGYTHVVWAQWLRSALSDFNFLPHVQYTGIFLTEQKGRTEGGGRGVGAVGCLVIVFAFRVRWIGTVRWNGNFRKNGVTANSLNKVTC